VIALRRRLTGLLALFVIAGIIVGLPTVLMAVGANPLAGGMPTLKGITHALMSPDDGTLAVGLIKIVSWVAWAFLTLSILFEVLARLRGVRAPHMPGLRLPQNAARGLVSAAMLLFVALPAGGAHAATPAPAAPLVAATQTVSAPVAVTPASAVPPTATPPAATPAAPKVPTVQHTVKRGETLWSIAADHLGDGHRFREIADLNKAVLGGNPGFIKAGWILELPAHPVAADGTIVVEKGDTLSKIALEQYGDASHYPEILAASRGIAQPGGAHLSNPDVIDVGWTLKVPAATPTQAQPAAAEPSPQSPPTPPPVPIPRSPTPQAPFAPPVSAPAGTAGPSAGTASASASAPSAPSASASPTTAAAQPGHAPTAATEHLQEDSVWMARTSYGVGALLAAGVITLLTSRRRTQQRRRRPGQRMPMPTGRAAGVEQELRATADALSIETVDVALRSLARSCIENGVALPLVRAARLTATQFDLYLGEPAELPEPWTATADTTVWTLEVDNTADLADVDVSSIPAPYPALVTIGHDEEDGHVLLDLEYLGSLGVTGDESATREILAALAIELANSTWADDLQITLVGAFPDLEDTLQTGRIRYLPSVGRVLDELLKRADLDRHDLAAAGAPNLHHARVTGAAPDSWSPEIVLIAGELTTRQRNQLERLIEDLPRVALAAVTSGVNVGEWGLDLTAGDGPEYAVLSPIGLQLRPQRLPAEQYGHLLEIASLADLEELDPDTGLLEPSLADVESVPPVDEPASAASAMPELTLEHLQAVAAQDHGLVVPHSPVSAPSTGGVSNPPGPPAHPLLVPETDRPAGDADIQDSDGEEHQLLLDAVDAVPGLDVQIDTAGPAAAPDDADIALSTAVTTGDDVPAASISDHNDPPEAPAQPMPRPAPRIAVLGPVDLVNAAGPVEPTKRARLLEYAAYLALTPGATHTAIDDAIWPDRGAGDNFNTRNTATSKLRRWVGPDPAGQDYLPRLQPGEGYGFLPAVTTDIADWDRLVGHDPLNAPTEHLEDALALVRGVPFEGTHRKRYAWAEPIKQRLIEGIVDASYELTRRRLMDGRWRAAEAAVVVGLRLDPAKESLWRLRILAAHESRDPVAETEAIERLLTITEQLECDLEPETEQLLAALKNPGTDFDRLMANAL